MESLQTLDILIGVGLALLFCCWCIVAPGHECLAMIVLWSEFMFVDTVYNLNALSTQCPLNLRTRLRQISIYHIIYVLYLFMIPSFILYYTCIIMYSTYYLFFYFRFVTLIRHAFIILLRTSFVNKTIVWSSSHR